MMLNFKTVMVSDGNSAHSDGEHTATLAAFYAVFGDVMDTDMVIACLRKNAACGRGGRMRPPPVRGQRGAERHGAALVFGHGPCGGGDACGGIALSLSMRLPPGSASGRLSASVMVEGWQRKGGSPPRWHTERRPQWLTSARH